MKTNAPHIQNVPVRTPLGRELQKAYRASQPSLFVSYDYTEIEKRLARLSNR